MVKCPATDRPRSARLRLPLHLTINYDAFANAEALLTQPLLMVAGSEPDSKWMSDDLLKRAASKDKKLYVVRGSNHMKFTTAQNTSTKRSRSLHHFFKKNLSAASRTTRIAAE
jgi:uncharacterized protein